MNAPQGCILPKPPKGAGTRGTSFDKKTRTALEAVSLSGGGYLVCQDLWELRARGFHAGRSTGSEAEGERAREAVRRAA